MLRYRQTWAPIERGRRVAGGSVCNVIDTAASRRAARSHDSLGASGPSRSRTHVATAARQHYPADAPLGARAPEIQQAANATASAPGATRSDGSDGSVALPRRRQFGPEPPPQQAATSDTSSQAGRSLIGEEAQPVPRRRGRPPKPQHDASGTGPIPMPVDSPPSHTTQSSSAGSAAPTIAAPRIGSHASPSSRSASTTASIPRKAFGPDLPPPAPPAGVDAAGTEATATADTPPPDLPTLPADPALLRPDDILNFPLPDARLGQPLRLDGIDELLGPDASVAADGDDVDDDSDMDYDRLIALGTRVDAANYIERAFERAKQGLDPTPDPLGKAEEPMASTAVRPDNVAPAAGSQPPQVAASSSSSSSTASASTASASTATSGAAAGPRTTPASGQSRRDSSQVPQRAGQRPAGSDGGSTNPADPGPSSAVYVDDMLDTDDAQSGGGGPSLGEQEAAVQRRVALLVDLMSASGAELEAKMEAAAPEVDEQLLVLLERRYAAALRLGQDEATRERIAALYRALRYVYQRRTSTPAERLLDDVLEILADAALQPDGERRRQDAAARLRNAFTGGMLDVDIFTAAAALAEGRQAAVEALAGEQVSLEAFKAETMQLLGHAKRVQAETRESLETIEAEVERVKREQPGTLQGPEWRVRLEQARLARQALSDREGSIEALEEVLLLTRAIEMQLLTGRMGGR